MENGERVAFVEADPQGTISKWKERRENPYPRVDRVADPAELERALSRLEAEGIWLAIIDTPPPNSSGRYRALKLTGSGSRSSIPPPRTTRWPCAPSPRPIFA